MREAGLHYDPPRRYAVVDAARATRIAVAYEAMPHDPRNIRVSRAYGSLIRETLAQWEAIKRTGLAVEFIRPGVQPYQKISEIFDDVNVNNHMWVFPTATGFGSSALDVRDNPLLAKTGETISGQPLLVNDVFRIVHDYFGHIKDGVGFRANGEENAWRSHAAMYSPLARQALTSETRGQNSWVNFGPHGVANRSASPEDTVYADQKTGLLPDWTVTEGATDVDIRPDLDVREPGDETVSPRNPTGKKSTENALDDPLQIGLAALRADPDAFAHNMALAAKYPNFARGQVRSPEKRAERMIEHIVDNLLWLHDHVPAEIRERSQLWYDGANRIATEWAEEYGAHRRAVAGVMAVLSPQKDWFMNVSLAKRVLDTMTYEQDRPWSDEMEATAARIFGKPEQAPLIEAIRGKTLRQLDDLGMKATWVRIFDEAHNSRDYQIVSPEGDFSDLARNADGRPSKVAWGSTPTIAKAISIFENPAMANIHRMLGNEHKVRSFYNNVIAPMSSGGHVTIDTHAVAAALLRPLSGNSREVLHNFGSGVLGEPGPRNSVVHGTSGLYGLYADAYRRASAARSVLPRQMQSITWEAVRGLFEPTFKAQQRNVDAIDAIWDNFSKGKVSLDEVRQQILELTGGVTAPEWFSAARHNAEARHAADAGPVHRTGMAGRRPRSDDRGGRAAAASAIPQAGARRVAKPASLDVNEGTPEPLWYSRLERAVTTKAPWAKDHTTGVGALRAWLGARAKDGTISAEEAKWSGLDDWLATRVGTISKAEVESFLQQNGVRVQDIELGEDPTARIEEFENALIEYLVEQRGATPREASDYAYSAARGTLTPRQLQSQDGSTRELSDELERLYELRHSGPQAHAGDGLTKFSGYQLPGGENYRELLLTLPEISGGDLARQAELRARPIESLSQAEREELSNIASGRGRDGNGGLFTSSHFDQPNILAHVRFNERTDAEGRRVLFLEELQSDWAQAGRKKGFGGPEREEALVKEVQALLPDMPTEAISTADIRAAGRADLAAQWDAAVRRGFQPGVPSAPFVGKTEAWVALALKRMIRYAADNGFDAVAWTTGEQQAERYDLSKQIDHIIFDQKKSGQGTLIAYGKDHERLISKTGVMPNDLPDIIGKEAAEKLMAMQPNYSGQRVLSNADLKVGGEGMRSFYDKIVPNVANDVLRKLGGGRVGNLTIETRGSGLFDRPFAPEDARIVERKSGNGLAAAYQVWVMNDLGVEQVRGGNFDTRAAAEAFIAKMNPKAGQQPGFVLTPELRTAGRKPQALFVFEPDAPEVDAVARASFVPDVAHRFANRLRDLRGLALQTLGRRQIVEIYRDDVPQLERYNTLAQQMDAEKNEGAADADAIADRWGKLHDERQLAELMHDATLAEIDPDKNFVEGHDINKYRALRRRFDALTDDAKQVYRDARKTYNRHWFAVREAIQQRIERAMPDNPMRARLLKRMDDEFFGRVKGVYFPLARFGDYVIVAKDAAGEKVAVSFAETLNEAEATRARMLRQFPAPRGFTVGKILARREFNASRDAVGRGFMQELFAVLDQSGAGKELQDAINQLYLTSLPDLSWAKHGIHRKGTPGFSQDARRAFAQNVFHGTRYLAKLRYADRLQDTLEAMQKHVDVRAGDDAYDSIAAQKVVDEMVKRHQIYMNQNVSQLSTALTSGGFIFHIGLSPASAIVNLTQTPLVAYPLMGARWGYSKAAGALLAASRQASVNGNDLRKVLKGDEARAFDDAVKAGVIDVTMAHDLAGIAAGEDTRVHWKMRPIMKAASFLFHHAEKFNRQATFIAAFRLARSAGADHAKAYAEAVDATYRGHFDYSAGNRPRFMQGNVARVVLLFKQFAQNMIYMLARTGLKAARGDKEAQKAFAGLLTTHALGAGILGLPIVSTLLAAASMVGGSDDEPWDAEVALRNYLADLFGQKPAEVLVHGLSRGTPWDISGRIGLDRLIFPDVQEGLEGARYAESWAASALGPVAGIGVNAMKGLDDMAKGNWSRGLEVMLPAALRGPVRALRYAREGEVDRKGIPVLENTTLAEELGQAVGFAPGRVREAQDAKYAVLNEEEQRKRRRTELLSQFGRAWLDRDETAKTRAQEAIREYNRVNSSTPITGQHLAASIRLRVRRAAESEHGYWLPRGRRAGAEELGRFGWQQ